MTFISQLSHKSKLAVIFTFVSVFTLSACQTRLGNLFSPASRQPVQTTELPPLGAPQPIDPDAPAPPVSTATPLDPATDGGTAIAPAPQAGSPAAAPNPQAGAIQLSRADMLGAWTLTSAQDNCQLFMTLTTWTGGYRATTKACNTIELANITAWDLSDNQIILVGATGAQVAMLTPTGPNHFSGQTNAGTALSVSR